MRKCLSCLKAFVTSLKNERVKLILRGFEEKRGINIPLFFYCFFSLFSILKKILKIISQNREILTYISYRDNFKNRE